MWDLDRIPHGSQPVTPCVRLCREPRCVGPDRGVRNQLYGNRQLIKRHEARLGIQLIESQARDASGAGSDLL